MLRAFDQLKAIKELEEQLSTRDSQMAERDQKISLRDQRIEK